MKKKITRIFNTLLDHFGEQHWWPAETKFEMCVGAILTQNTAWTNVEKALSNLKEYNLLTPSALSEIEEKKLARFIKPSGYFNIKAKRLKSFLSFLENQYKGNLDYFFNSKDNLREKLLEVNGIGPETADSILLYAGNIPVFVIDAYTKRIFSRLALTPPGASYNELQTFFMRHLTLNAEMFNEFHALIVMLGKNYCRPKAACTSCPLTYCQHRKKQ